MTGREEEKPANEAMIYGTANEFRAVTAVECSMGMLFEGTGDDQHREYLDLDWAMLSAKPDGFINEVPRVGLEVKCPQKLKGEIPPVYQVQLAGQFMICGFERILYCEWTPAEKNMWWVYPSKEFEDALYQPLREFVEYVETDTEPPRYSKKANPKPSFPSLKQEKIDA